jgi:hypothetical protein
MHTKVRKIRATNLSGNSTQIDLLLQDQGELLRLVQPGASTIFKVEMMMKASRLTFLLHWPRKRFRFQAPVERERILVI